MTLNDDSHSHRLDSSTSADSSRPRRWKSERPSTRPAPTARSTGSTLVIIGFGDCSEDGCEDGFIEGAFCTECRDRTEDALIAG
jgi:hypothetical protein